MVNMFRPKLTLIKHDCYRSKMKFLFNLTGGLSAITLCMTSCVLPASTQPKQARSADSFVDSIGVVTHLQYLDTAYGNYNEIIKPRLQELGIRHIREGGYQNMEYFNKLKELGNLGIKSTVTFFGNPPAEVVSTAKTLKGAIEAVEGPNETDLQHFNFKYNGKVFPEATREYQKDLYTAIKGDPDTKYLPVLLPSMGWGENAAKLGYLEWGDIGNMHSYPNPGYLPSSDLDWYYMPHARKIAGNTKPLMATETGYHTLTASGISETAAGKYVPRLLLEHFNRNVERTYLYELIDEKPDPSNSNGELHYGLLRNDGSIKPSYEVVKNLITLLKEPGAKFSPGSLDYTLSGDTKNVHHTLVQKSNGEFYLIVWQEVKSWDHTNKKDIAVAERNVTLTLNSVISKAVAYQPINSITALWQSTSPSSGRLDQMTLSVPDHPLVIKLTP